MGRRPGSVTQRTRTRGGRPANAPTTMPPSGQGAGCHPAAGETGCRPATGRRGYRPATGSESHRLMKAAWGCSPADGAAGAQPNRRRYRNASRPMAMPGRLPAKDDAGTHPSRGDRNQPLRHRNVALRMAGEGIPAQPQQCFGGWGRCRTRRCDVRPPCSGGPTGDHADLPSACGRGRGRKRAVVGDLCCDNRTSAWLRGDGLRAPRRPCLAVCVEG